MFTPYSSNRKGVENVLLKFAEQLKHPDNFDKEGKSLAQNVFLKLQEKARNFLIAGPHFGGSFGKKTDVIEPDLDLVVLVTNCHPQQGYSTVLEEFENILIQNCSELKIIEDSFGRTRFAIQFKFENGIEVDLLPAANLSVSEIYAAIAEDPDTYYSYSSCLVQKQKDFMASQNSFAHSLVRLAKYWFKSVQVGVGGKKFSGGGLIMELLGVAAAEIESRKDEPSILSGLACVLSMISKLDTLKLVFKQEGGNWRRVMERELSINLVQNQTVGSQDILNRKYFIVEPANPWNDLLHDKSLDDIKNLKKYAEVTLDRLQKIMQFSPEYVKVNRGSIAIDLFKLFEPQPEMLKQELPLAIPTNVLVTYNGTSVSHTTNSMTVRREEPMQKFEVRLFVEFMKWNLQSSIQSLKFGSSDGDLGNNVSVTDVRQAIVGMLESKLQKKLVEADPCARHEDKDVTLIVPYCIGDDKDAIILSMNWS